MLRRLVGMDNSTVSTADSASEGLLSGMSLSGTASLLPTFTSNGITPNHSALTGFNQKELIHSLASRLLHSTSYQVFYVIMAVLSLVCLAISMTHKCPPGWFYVLESLIIISLVLEVGVRFLAYRKRYWHSVWNILDIVMVLFCVVAFVFVVGGACDSTKRKEAVAEEILLIFRNGIQFSRLVLMMQKNRTSLASRTRNIDIGSVSSADAIHMVPDIDSHIYWCVF
ncbi:hypothetical protein BASA62_009992 [Batrachochytrium salamandrivorans]|nr:hypothetical protein BASA62_009992 [Batrachochytrium salamandrivorans]